MQTLGNNDDGTGVDVVKLEIEESGVETGNECGRQAVMPLKLS